MDKAHARPCVQALRPACTAGMPDGGHSLGTATTLQKAPRLGPERLSHIYRAEFIDTIGMGDINGHIKLTILKGAQISPNQSVCRI